MCRIIAVFVLLIVSCVLGDTNVTEETCRQNSPELREGRKHLNYCYEDVVTFYYNHTAFNGTNSKTTCRIVSDFNNTLTSYFTNVTRLCKIRMTRSKDRLLEMLEHSLNNTYFRGFYGDNIGPNCVQHLKPNITQCVTNVGSFRYNKVHSSWYQKSHLTYEKTGCHNARTIRNCTLDLMKKYCKQVSLQYVESLFDFSIKNCPPPTTTTTEPDKAAVSNGLIIGVSVGAVTITMVVIILVVVSYKKKTVA